jgi:hypothetical protein
MKINGARFSDYSANPSYSVQPKSPSLVFSGVEADIKQAKKQLEYQKKMQLAQAELQRFPEYPELMMSDIELSYGKNIKGYQLLQLIQEKQNRQIYGIVPNAKRLAIGALSATVVGGFVYWIANGAVADRNPGESFEDILYTFTNRLDTQKFKDTLEVHNRSGNFGRIMGSSLIRYSNERDYFGLSPLGKSVLKSFLEQERLGLLKPTSEQIEKNWSASELDTQSKQLAKMFSPVFPQEIESPSVYGLLKTLADLDKNRSWVQKKLGQGITRSQILKQLRLNNIALNNIETGKGLKPEAELAFSAALACLMEGNLILSNKALSRFTLTPLGVDFAKGAMQSNSLSNSLSNSPANSPFVLTRPLYVSVLKNMIQDLKNEKEANRQQLHRLDSELKQIESEADKTAQIKAQKLQVCQALKEKGPSGSLDGSIQSVPPRRKGQTILEHIKVQQEQASRALTEKSQLGPNERKGLYILHVDHAVEAYREAEVKHQVMMERLTEYQKNHEQGKLTVGKNLQYLDQLLGQLQEKQWLTETPSGRFVPEEALSYLELLAKQLHVFKNGLKTDLISNPTQQEVDRLLTELSVEEKLNQVLAEASES